MTNQRTVLDLRVFALSAAVTAGAALACGESATQTVAIPLTRVVDSAPASWSGMSNIFFSSPPPDIRDSLVIGEGWTELELADVVRGQGLVTIYAARFKPRGSDKPRYVVDTDGDLNFVEERDLWFRGGDAVRIADVEIVARSEGGTRGSVRYEVVLSDDGYAYARIAEYRAGRVRLGDRDYAVRLRSTGRSHPFYDPHDGTVLLIDADGDGTFAEGTTVTAEGQVSASEEVMPGLPFMVAGRPYEVVDIDSGGSRLVLQPSAERSAAAPGFVAPDISAQVLSGREYHLSDDRGLVLLLEFWSVNCPFSDRALPGLNALAARVAGAPFRWVAMARESSAVAIRDHLAQHPMSATVVLHDSTAWALYDPAVATPLFYVIDQDGVVRLRAVGTSAVDAVAAEVVELLNGSSAIGMERR